MTIRPPEPEAPRPTEPEVEIPPFGEPVPSGSPPEYSPQGEPGWESPGEQEPPSEPES
jgi:hypothetical protein